MEKETQKTVTIIIQSQENIEEEEQELKSYVDIVIKEVKKR